MRSFKSRSSGRDLGERAKEGACQREQEQSLKERLDKQEDWQVKSGQMLF